MKNLPALIIGLVMAVYWARVLRLAWKQKQRTGNAGNLFPREKLGRVLRIAWFPAVGLWIALPLIANTRLGRAGWLQPVFYNDILAWVAVGVALLAFIATLICWKKMGSAWRMGINPEDRTQLIVSGPYAYLRHPIYALSSLLMVCTMAILPSIPMLIVGIIHLLLLQWEARREERFLTTLHGEVYSQYAAGTGRFVPRLWQDRRSV